jgi:ATP-dependent Clp protease ATP-binding subunit ClpX
MSKLSAKEKTFFENKLDKIRERVSLESDIETDEFELKTPKEIFEYLDRFVVGQDQAKRILSVCAHNHYKRLLIYRNSGFEKRLDKTNMLMLGPTGSGKTYLVKKLAECLGVPCYIADASQLTAAGYVGKDVDSLVEGLINSCNGNYDAAATGIIFIDEFDKIAKRKGGGSKTKDVGGEAVQQGLLKLIEGTQVEIEKNQGLTKIKMTLDTSNILVIVGGAFVDIEEVINKRLKTGPTTSIGFNIKTQEEEQSKEDVLQYVTPEDIEEFGFIPELLGRLPLIAPLKELTENDLLNILTIAEGNLVEQYSELFDFTGNKLDFETDALTEIAKTAKTLKTGARSLKTIMETVLLDKMFDLEDAKITKDYVSQKIQARLHNGSAT